MPKWTLQRKRKGKIDEVMHKHISEQFSCDRCSVDWRKAYKEINTKPEIKKDLIKKLKTLG